MEKVLFHHGGTKLPSQRNKMFTMMERNLLHEGTKLSPHTKAVIILKKR